MWLNLSPGVKSELKTVTKGATTMTLSKSKRPNDKILIVDTTDGVAWYEGVHYTLDGNTVTFNNPLQHSLGFIIYKLAY